MKSIEEGQLMLYCLKQALEHAKNQSESTYKICAGDEIKKVLPKLIEFVEKFKVGEKVELRIRRSGGLETAEMPCKEKVELLMQRTEDQYEQMQALKKRVSDLEWKISVVERGKDLGWVRNAPRPSWHYDNPCFMGGLTAVNCAVPTNDISRNMSDGSSVNQRPADWSNHEPQTDAVPDSPPEREA